MCQVPDNVFICEHPDDFCHSREAPPTPQMKRNLQCLSEYDRTAVSQLHFFFHAYYFLAVDKVGLTHIHTHTNQHVCFQLLFLLTERWERQRELVRAVEMPHHFTHSVFLTISDLVYWCYFNIFPIILCCSRQLLPSPLLFSFPFLPADG